MLYTINPGHSFLDADGSVKKGGDRIALSDDVAAAHRDRVTACADADTDTDTDIDTVQACTRADDEVIMTAAPDRLA